MMYREWANALILCALFYMPGIKSNELRLQQYLSKNFSNKARPVLDSRTPVVVKFGFEIIQILDVLETEQVITLKIWMRSSWNSELLRWKPQEFDNITSLQVNVEDVWTPDMFLVEDIRDVSSKTTTKIIISNNGDQLWFHPCIIKASCRFDIDRFPFDHQHCVLRYTSWTNDETKLILRMDHRPMISYNYVNSSLFSLREIESDATSILYECCPNKYSQLRYTLMIDRKPQYYILHNLVPCAVQMTVILFSFFLPAKYGQRISLLITILLVFAVYLQVLQDSLPKASGSTPALSAFFMICMVLTVVAFIMTCIVLSLYSKGTDANNVEEVQEWVRNVFIKCLGRIVFIDSRVMARRTYSDIDEVRKAANSEALVEQLPESIKLEMDRVLCTAGEYTENEWCLISRILNRFFFGLVSISFFVAWVMLLHPIFLTHLEGMS